MAAYGTIQPELITGRYVATQDAGKVEAVFLPNFLLCLVCPKSLPEKGPDVVTGKE